MTNMQPSTASILAIALGLLLGRKNCPRLGAPFPSGSSSPEKNKASDTKESNDDHQRQD